VNKQNGGFAKYVWKKSSKMGGKAVRGRGVGAKNDARMGRSKRCRVCLGWWGGGDWGRCRKWATRGGRGGMKQTDG